MIFYQFLMFIIVIIGGYFIYKVAFDAWKKSSTMDKLDEIDLENDIHIDIEGVDLEKSIRNKKDIDNFLN